ncbi:helix-turn-helix domain-containing protein [Lentiprolixibacter aurantiacus]|uniref:Helix-turn-helix domain-containing protein n=1 Tax=Lentiprolixibacter aurantiacus TaxID=2993939 RepID=A0AAE3MME4_9FLAO|nr:helix-turn-helix domain-containing protein [Lentiprolixibacter aurantiacus]MCX2719512.1 helix-turn-helix domain-containing protein [Lentiprolixibacter aurantiacus]
MVNTEAFVGRLEEILQFYGLTASSFADRIGVQRSSISHLLSGRNKPSLEFVMKVVRTFPEVNLYWLLNGKGSFPHKPEESKTTSPSTKISGTIPTESPDGIEKILVFYTDGSFKSYFPKK